MISKRTLWTIVIPTYCSKTQKLLVLIGFSATIANVNNIHQVTI